MRDPILAGLTAFFVEHQYCGELDGGRDNGSIWLQCSCGAHITHPPSIPAPIPAEYNGGSFKTRADYVNYKECGSLMVRGEA